MGPVWSYVSGWTDAGKMVPRSSALVFGPASVSRAGPANAAPGGGGFGSVS